VVATDEPGRTATISVQPRSGAIHVVYRLSRPSTVAAIGFAFRASRLDHFLGTGQRTRWVDMRGTAVPLKAFNACGSSSPSAFFVGSGGFGAWSETTSVGRIGFPGVAENDPNFNCELGSPPCSVGPPIDAVRICFKDSAATFDLATGSVRALLERHARAVGLPRAPWLPQLALVKWRDSIAGAAELFDDIQQMRSRGLPIGWVILDNPWEAGSAHDDCYGSLTFDPAVYPDPQQMIASIHALGVKFMLWISPQINRVTCPPPGLPDGWLTGDDRTYVRDLTLPAERSEFTADLKRLVALGVDGFKGDRGDEVNLEPDTLSAGPGVRYQNVIPLLYDRAAAAALSASHGPQFATMFRSFVPGSSSVLPGFIGPDSDHTFDGLAGSIRAAQTAGIAGAPTWGSDIGGYSGGTLTPEVFVRWAQFAALTPIFEVGGAGPSATFWQLGNAAIAGFKAAATLHYELAPYLYELGVEASRTGLPVVRPLGLSWPRDARAWSHSLEFTVGDALLAAPVTVTGGTDGSAAASVYLPAGTWIDLFNGGTTVGPKTASRRSGPNGFPLYLRSGAAIPDNFRTPSLWSSPWLPDDLQRPDRQGWLAAPRLGATARAVDRQSTFTATADPNGVVTITVTHALRQQQLVVFAPRAVCRVTSDAGVVPRASVDGLPGASSGWALDPSPPRGLVVKIDGAPATLQLHLSPCA
jgi:alpha-D-xyloside xylohydrolase